MLKSLSRKYFIEYGGYLSNHIVHGVIALDRLGCDSKRIERFVDVYSKKLEQVDKTPETVVESFDKSLLGKRQNYYGLVEFYEKEIEKLGKEKVINTYFNKLVKGLSGSAFHGMIQLGYGYYSGYDELTAEGLAYLHFSCLPLADDAIPYEPKKTNKFKIFTESFVKVLEQVQQEGKLKNIWTNGEGRKDTSPFQAKLGLIGEKGLSQLNDYSQQIPLIDKENASWYVDLLLLLLYSTSKEDSVDFFLIHGVTSSWSVTQLADILSEDDWNYSQYCLINSLIATYSVQKSPIVDLNKPIPKQEKNWDDLLEPLLQYDQDEHFFKIAQIAKENTTLDPNMLKSLVIRSQKYWF